MTKSFCSIFAVLFIINCFSQDIISVNQKAPTITITDWVANNPKGNNLNNKYIVLEFWATWCAPCLKQVPHLNALQNTFKENKDLYFISITNEEPLKIKKLLERVEFKSIVVTDTSNKTQIHYGDGKKGISRLPLTVLIDKDGFIKWIGTARQLNETVLKAFLENNLIVQEKTIYKEDDNLNKELYDNQNKNLLSRFLYIINNDSIDYHFEIKESNPSIYNFKSKNKASNNFYLADSDIKELLVSLGYNPNEIILEDNNNLKTYNLIYKNKNFNPTSLKKLEDKILRYTNYKKTNDSAIIDVKKLKITHSKLLQKTQAKTTSELRLDKNKKIFYKYTIKELVEMLNKNTSSYYFIDFNDPRYYDFEIDMSSDLSIKSCLLGYGISIDNSNEKISVIKISRL